MNYKQTMDLMLSVINRVHFINIGTMNIDFKLNSDFKSVELVSDLDTDWVDSIYHWLYPSDNQEIVNDKFISYLFVNIFPF